MHAASHDVQNNPAFPPPPQPGTAVADIPTPAPASETADVDSVKSDITGHAIQEKKPKPETNSAFHATTPAVEMAVPSPAVVAADVDTVKPDNEHPPPPPHDSEGSDIQSVDDHDHGGAQKERLKLDVEGKPDVAASASRLLAFRSFARHGQAKGWGEVPSPASPGGRVPSPGGRQAQGKTVVESKEQKDKGREPARRFWR